MELKYVYFGAKMFEIYAYFFIMDISSEFSEVPSCTNCVEYHCIIYCQGYHLVVYHLDISVCH